MHHNVSSMCVCVRVCRLQDEFPMYVYGLIKYLILSYLILYIQPEIHNYGFLIQRNITEKLLPCGI